MFQDALLVTTESNFENIWINSLCTVQGDIDDGKHEAPLMCEVYQMPIATYLLLLLRTGEAGFMLRQRRLDLALVFAKLQWKNSRVSGYNASRATRTALL